MTNIYQSPLKWRESGPSLTSRLNFPTSRLYFPPSCKSYSPSLSSSFPTSIHFLFSYFGQSAQLNLTSATLVPFLLHSCFLTQTLLHYLHFSSFLHYSTDLHFPHARFSLMFKLSLPPSLGQPVSPFKLVPIISVGHTRAPVSLQWVTCTILKATANILFPLLW